MIAQFDSKCFLCKGTVKSGSDVYYTKGEGTAHWHCYENQKPSPADYDKAERLGFIHVDFDMGADGLLRRMLPRDRDSGASAGRASASTHSQPAAILPFTDEE